MDAPQLIVGPTSVVSERVRSTSVPSGYNQVFVLPVGATSISVREMTATRNYLGTFSFRQTRLRPFLRLTKVPPLCVTSGQKPAGGVLPQRSLGDRVLQSHAHRRHRALLPTGRRGRQRS